MFAIAHSNLTRLRFPLAHHQHVWDLCQLRFTNFEVHLLAAVIQLDTETGSL